MKTLIIIIIIQIAGLEFQTTSNREIAKPGITIFGTSSLHDWESTLEEFNRSATIKTDRNTLLEISKLEFSAAVKAIKSGKDTMDSKTYEALKEASHPTITYRLLSAQIQSESMIESTGELIVAGKKHKVHMIIKYNIQQNSIKFSGKFKLRMSDYGISPPTALMGTIKTGDEVTIDFSIPFDI